MKKTVTEDHFLFKMLTAITVSKMCMTHYQTQYISENNSIDGIIIEYPGLYLRTFLCHFSEPI